MDVLFYHLEHQPLERVLPPLLEKTIARGWWAVVQTGSAERLAAIDTELWTYRDDSFLPHGTAADGFADQQPIYLTTGPDTPNAAGVRFLVDGAACDFAAQSGMARIVVLFDGRDTDALAQAREQWRAAKAVASEATYWQQSPQGRWERKA
ncbi:MAG: DNA polymerase III subunit chi [Hyphomicrobiaceae bacterium]|nr:DNA polymerase III subunit chi [Hyphomicrobiaceae bacterium]